MPYIRKLFKNLVTIVFNAYFQYLLVHSYGKLVHFFGKLAHVFGKLAHIFGKLVHIFAQKLVSRNSKQVSRNLGPLWQPGFYNDTKQKRVMLHTKLHLYHSQTVHRNHFLCN